MSGLGSLGGAPKCPRCNKSVYFAEEAVAKGQKWHKRCLTCAMCNKGLDSFTLNEHGEDIYCKGCFTKNFAPKGFGAGAAGLHAAGANAVGYNQAMMVGRDSGDSKVQHRNGCPRCGKAVYFAEETIAIGKKWHKMCLKCGNCKKLLDSGSVTEHDGDAFCKSCYGKLFGPQGYGFSGGSAGLSANDTHNGHRPQRSSYAEAQAAPIAGKQSSFSAGPKCPRCEKTVYFAEEIIAVGQKWHKTCLKCSECSKTLDPGSLQENNGNPYCKSCYGKAFGPKGYGFAGGSAGLSSNSYREGDQNPRNSYAAAQGASVRGEESAHSVGPKCSRCAKTVYFAEEVVACRRKWHKLCLKCEECDKLLSVGAYQEHDDCPFCKQCYGKLFGPKGYGFAGGSAGLSANRDDETQEQVTMRNSYAESQVPKRSSNYSGAPECPRCEQPVYFAEEIFAIGMKWHKACLKCNSCGKKLDSSAVNEHDQEIYCRTCYSKHFGVKGYGFAGGAAGGLSADFNGRADFSNNDTNNTYNINEPEYSVNY